MKRSSTITRPAYSSGARLSSARPCTAMLYSSCVSSAGIAAASARAASVSESPASSEPGNACSTAICCSRRATSSSVPAADRPRPRNAFTSPSIAAASRRESDSTMRLAWLRSTVPSIARTAASSSTPAP